jgi:hypothetical protein
MCDEQDGLFRPCFVAGAATKPFFLNPPMGGERLIARGCDDASRHTGEETMFRKTILALAATVAVGAAMLTPTTASAWHHHHHHHGLRAFAFGAAVIAAPVVASCYQYRLVETRRGLRRVLVNVCAY